MDKVETKRFINSKEVTLIAERYGTKIYLGTDGVYITQYEEVVAKVDDIAHICVAEEFKNDFNEKH